MFHICVAIRGTLLQLVWFLGDICHLSRFGGHKMVQNDSTFVPFVPFVTVSWSGFRIFLHFSLHFVHSYWARQFGNNSKMVEVFLEFIWCRFSMGTTIEWTRKHHWMHSYIEIPIFMLNFRHVLTSTGIFISFSMTLNLHKFCPTIWHHHFNLICCSLNKNEMRLKQYAITINVHILLALILLRHDLKFD